jgi:hypothetical protein
MPKVKKPRFWAQPTIKAVVNAVIIDTTSNFSNVVFIIVFNSFFHQKSPLNEGACIGLCV